MSGLRADRFIPPRGTPAWWARHWLRTLAVVSVLVLLAGTHYPRLMIGTPGDGPDKILHFLAFGTVTVLLRISGIAASAGSALVMVASLAIFDELTQKIPGLGRSFDPFDLVADAAGILVALAWIAALGPDRRGPEWFRIRQIRRLASLVLLLSSPANWLHLAIATSLGAMVGGVFLGVAGRNPIVGPVTMVVVGAAAGGIAGLVACLESGRRFSTARMDEEQRCLDCLTPSGSPRCEVCGGEYRGPCDRRIPSRRIAMTATIWTIGSAILLFGGYLLLMPFSNDRNWVGAAIRRYDTLGLSFEMMVDAALLGLISAFVVHRSRRRISRIAARYGIECLRCGHDLQGLPEHAEPRCPECGEAFEGDPTATPVAARTESEEHGG